MSTDRLSELYLGQRATVCRKVTAEDVAAFAQLSGDHNALHVDSEFAARTEFTRPVAHGFLHASMLSTLIGMKLPGRGALYLSQSIEFSAPVFIGDVLKPRLQLKRLTARLVSSNSQLRLSTRTNSPFYAAGGVLRYYTSRQPPPLRLQARINL